MKPLLIYLIGVATPFLVYAIYCAGYLWADHREFRRYERAWAMFTAEFDAMRPGERAAFFATKDSDAYNNYAERDRYFMFRWQHGRTTEV
jgi:hypothetical protein